MELRFEKHGGEVADHQSSIGLFEYNEDRLVFAAGAHEHTLTEVRCYAYGDHGGGSEYIFYKAALLRGDAGALFVTLDRMREVSYVGTSVDERVVFTSDDEGRSWRQLDATQAELLRGQLEQMPRLSSATAQ